MHSEFNHEILRSARRDRKLIGYHSSRHDRAGHDELNQAREFRSRTTASMFLFQLSTRQKPAVVILQATLGSGAYGFDERDKPPLAIRCAPLFPRNGSKSGIHAE
jgi:hypothetical protein